MEDFEKKAAKFKQEEEKKIIKEQWQENWLNFFGFMSILEQSPENKQQIALLVKEDLKVGRLYWIQIVISSLIATFGLLQNSVAVIIGAMLIAPLLKPIQGIAYGISEGSTKLILKSAKLLVISSIVSILLAYFVVLVLPFKTETSEILARTSPNIFDLFIAGLSAIIALLSLSFKKLLDSVAGVAMAASLMPPLSVVGIELAFGNYISSWGGFLLFFTNIIAILFIGAILFIFYGFRPHKEDSEKTAKNIGILILVIIALSFPLISGLTEISRKIETESVSKKIISQILEEKIPDASIKSIEVLGSSSNEKVNISGDISLPENVDFFSEVIDETVGNLSTELNKEVKLDLNIVRTATIVSKDQKYSLNQQISEAIKEIFTTNVKDGILVRTEVIQIPEEEKTFLVKVLYTISAGNILEDSEKKVLQKYLAKRFSGLKIKHLWTQLAENQKIKTTDSHIGELEKQYSAKIEQFLEEKMSPFQGSFENISLQIDEEKNKLQANINLFVPSEKIEEFMANFASEMKEFEDGLSFQEKSIEYKIFPYFNFKAEKEVEKKEENPEN